MGHISGCPAGCDACTATAVRACCEVQTTQEKNELEKEAAELREKNAQLQETVEEYQDELDEMEEQHKTLLNSRAVTKSPSATPRSKHHAFSACRINCRPVSRNGIARLEKRDYVNNTKRNELGE